MLNNVCERVSDSGAEDTRLGGRRKILRMAETAQSMVKDSLDARA